MKWKKWKLFSTRLSRALLILFILCGTLLARDKNQDRALADALFTNGSLLQLKIEIPSTDVAALTKTPHRFVRATLNEGDVAYTNVALHLKGSIGSFRQINDKPGLTLSFSHYESGTNFHGLKKFHLNNCVQDPTFLSDWLCNGLFREAGVPAPFCAHAFVELNGRKLGLYALMESNNRDFLARYFKNTQGNVYGQPGHCEITDALERMEGKGPLDRADLKALAAACQEPNPAKRWERLQKTLDVDRFLAFTAMEVMLCDWDGYTAAKHNFRVYQDMDTGRMVFFPHDKDQMLANSGQPIMPSPAGLVAQAILNTPEGRQLYRERAGFLFTNVFRVPDITKRIEQLVAKLLPGLQAYNENFARNFVNQANGLKGRVISRGQGLERQFHAPPPPPKPAIAAAPAPKPALPSTNPSQKVPLVDPVKAQWEPVQAQNASKLEKIQLDNKQVLYIKSEQANSVGAWRANVVLGPGKYRFSGRAKTRGLAPQETRYGSGGGLRISGNIRQNKLNGDQDWTTLAEEFNVEADRPVRLLCELRANKGEIWFDLQSLKLERVK